MRPMPRTSSPLELLVALQRGGDAATRSSSRRSCATRCATGGWRPGRGCRPRARSLRSWASRAAWWSRRTASSPPRGTSRSRRGAAPVVRAVGSPRRRPRRGCAARARRRATTCGPACPTSPRSRAPRGAARCAARCARLPDADLGYPDPAGHPRLRAALAGVPRARTRRRRRARSGSWSAAAWREALRLTALVLRARGATAIAVEDPSHAETQAQLAYGGLAPVPVAGRRRRPAIPRASPPASAPCSSRPRTTSPPAS